MLRNSCFFLLLLLVTPNAFSQTPVDPSSVVGKVICGYQGWFTCYGDGSPIASWRHWAAGQYQSNTPRPVPGNVKFELYPDVSGYGAGQLFQTGLGNLGDGSPAKLFSSYPKEVIDLHFSWMQQNGIDGIALQRFIAETFDGVFKAHRDSVGARVKRSAEKYKRTFYLMYDLSGLDVTKFEALKTDFANTIVGQLKLTASSAYTRQNGKPVVCLWGPGFTHVAGNAAQMLDLINWFKAQGCYVIGGTPTHWRTGTGDSKAGFESVYKAFDMISPWTVGRYTNIQEANDFRNNLLVPDLNWCNANSIAYQPVIFPGFAWSNWNGGSKNPIPRNKGDFMWQQAYNIRQLNIPSMYVAMFDEYDEGTAIAPGADSYLGVPTNQYFLTYSADGTYIGADFYLRLTGQATKMIKNTIPAQATHNLKYAVGPTHLRTSVESGYDALPHWTNTIEQTTVMTNLSGSSASGGPTCGISTEKAHSGLASLKLSGQDNSATNSYSYFKVFDVDATITAGTVLQFWTFPENERSRRISVDLIMTDGTNLRDSGAKDENGISMHPGAGRGVLNQWTLTRCKLGGWLVGKTIDRVVIAYDYGPDTGPVSGFVDDIALFNSGAVTGVFSPDFSQAEVSIPMYPNPLTADEFTLDLSNIAGASGILMQVFDVWGRALLQKNLRAGQIETVALPHLPAGTYWVALTGDHFRYSKKLMKRF